MNLTVLECLVEEIGLSRKAARLTRTEVSSILRLSREWLRLVENGEQPITHDVKERILQAISQFVHSRIIFAMRGKS